MQMYQNQNKAIKNNKSNNEATKFVGTHIK